MHGVQHQKHTGALTHLGRLELQAPMSAIAGLTLRFMPLGPVRSAPWSATHSIASLTLMFEPYAHLHTGSSTPALAVGVPRASH